MARNPFFTPVAPVVAESTRDHLRKIVTTFFQANAARAVIPDAEVIALHPLLAVPAVLQAIKDDLGA